MRRRYTYFPLILSALGGLAWWSAHMERGLPTDGWNSSDPALEGSRLTIQASHRRELLEVLDRVVAYEHYYRSVYGHYTKFLNRIGFSIPRNITELYEIRVTEATKDRLVVSAVSEVDGNTGDLVTVDQEYKIQSNFPLPPPRREFLKLQAGKYLRQLRDAPVGNSPKEPGIFTGYFRYEVRRDSRDRPVAVAVGVRPPVLGTQLDSGGSEKLGVQEWNEKGLEIEPIPTTGQRGLASVGGVAMSTLEEAYLAQRIFRGEVGRYARDWSELSRITDFRFEGRDQYSSGVVPFGENGPIPDLEDATEAANRIPSQSQDLIVEPIPTSDSAN